MRPPTRLKYDSHLIEKPTFGILVRALLRRASALATLHGGQDLDIDYQALIDRAEAVRLDRDETIWVDWERYSARQDTRMKLGGVVGEAEYTGDLATFVPLLAVGEWIHVGKNATFGLGKFNVVAGG
ncbi:MAG: CRISPR system precrRNA processing endoribonuclease RAMP protein Cas6 [Bacillota bacterium]